MRFLPVLLIIPILVNAQQINFPQDTIAYDNLFNNRQFAAYDLQGKTHLSYTGQDGTNGNSREIYYLREEDNGTFTRTNITNNAVDDNYSTLSIDGNGKVHIGYEGRDASDLFQIKYTNNVSGSFIPPIDITTGGINKALPFSKIGPDSVMHFVYLTYTINNDYAYYRSYDLRTSTLSSELYLANAEASGDFEAALDVDSQGKVHIVIKTGNLSPFLLKYFSNKSGTMQEYPTGVSTSVSYPRITIDNSNYVHILYRESGTNRLNYLNNIGGTFSAPLPVTPPGQLPSGFQNFAIDDNDNVYIVFQSSVSASGKGFFLVFGDKGIFTDTMKVYDLTPEYVTRNSSMVIAKGNGDFAVFYAPGAVRNSLVICDIFRKQGNIFSIVPVELESFTASYENNKVLLNWRTASEVNNEGFEIHSSPDNQNFSMIGSVKGKGNSTERNEYSFADKQIYNPVIYYRLIQVDYDGTRHIAGETVVNTGITLMNFTLMQNYPNPFNPSTKIKYVIPEKSFVSLKLYDILGNCAAQLVDTEQDAGIHELTLNAADYSSGVYFYTITAGKFTASKKLVIIK